MTAFVALLLALAQDPLPAEGGLAVQAREGQAASRPALSFPAGVELVQLVVSVTAKDGVPVRDLQARDFVVRENGKPRNIETLLRTHQAEDAGQAPVELLLLFDTSTSMSRDLANARDVIVDFAKAVPSFSKGRILAFDREAYDRGFDAESVAPVLDEMIRLKGGAGTRIWDAVIDGASLVSKQRGRRVMVLFTDGDDSTSRRDLASAVKALQNAEVTLYGVSYAPRLASFGSGGGAYKSLAREAQRSLETLARGSGGFVIDGTSPDVVAQLKRIVDDIKALYVIGFVPAPSGKLEHRKLKVEIARRRDLTVRHREGYEAGR